PSSWPERPSPFVRQKDQNLLPIPRQHVTQTLALNSPATTALGFVSLGPLPTNPSTKLDRARGNPSHNLPLQGYSCRCWWNVHALSNKCLLCLHISTLHAGIG